jgi:DNA-binding response OmpR family regulator
MFLNKSFGWGGCFCDMMKISNYLLRYFTMTNTRVMILEGQNGQSFFLKETLLAEGLADSVTLVNQANQAIDLLRSLPYDLVVINLVEAWEQGLRLSFWLSQYDSSCPTILIIPLDLDRALPTNGAFNILTEPLSLRDFAAEVRVILQPQGTAVAAPSNISSFFNLPGLPEWSGGPLNHEYAGFWSPYTQSLLS